MTALIRILLLVAALLLLATTAPACSRDAQPSTDHEQAGGYGQWAGEEPENWPRIAMVSRIRYSDSNHPVGPSAFLLQNGDEIVAVTAKHVLRFFKSEAMDSVSFRGTLVNWELSPKDAPADVTVLGALINENEEEPLENIRVARDWILFTVESTSKSVTPLRLRTTRLNKGETVFVVGWRYTDEGKQHVYRGKYVRSEKGSVLIDARELADNTIPGLSGAPVIDARGYVVGLMSQKSGKLQRLASIDYPRKVLDEQPRPEISSRAFAGTVESPTDCAQRLTEHFGRSGWIGITPEDDAAGVTTVVEVFTNSPAYKAGVRQGDIIRTIKGAPRPGVTVVLDLERDDARLSAEVLVEPIPEPVLQQWIRKECF